jgi:uncharacterized membrane protein YdbT with pleckstrin-like domain
MVEISSQIAFLWFIAFAFFDWILVLLYVFSTEYFVSNKRIFIKRGILGRASHDLKIEWITGTVVHQGLLGRALNFGDISFTGSSICFASASANPIRFEV